MRYNILSNGEVINTIVADEDFCEHYCETNGYTYELVPEIPIETTNQSLEDRVAAIESTLNIESTTEQTLEERVAAIESALGEEVVNYGT